MWDGWIRLTLFYPENATDKEWRIGEEGETRFDEELMWQEYTGSIYVRLRDVENVWIRYNIDGEDVVVAPSGRLAVDIKPDSYYPTMKEKVKIEIYYDKEAVLKEYKVGNSPWQEYKGEFYVTENTIVEARAKKTEKISDNNGNIIGEKEIWGRDSIYVGNIDIEESDLVAPTIIRKEADNSIINEKAKLEVKYPEEAKKKIYKINYGEEIQYTKEISVTEYGTHVIAYYYDSKGKRSKATQIVINKEVTREEEYVPNKPGKPEDDDTGSNPKEPSYVIEAPNIIVSPSDITESVDVKINIPSGYIADKIYYKVGDGNYQLYKDSFNISTNTTITSYYITVNGERSNTSRRRITNIQELGKPYIGINVDPDPYQVKYNAGKVKVTIISKDADKVEYSFNGVVYEEYKGTFEVTKNTRVYARGTNSTGERVEYVDITNLGNEPPKREKLGVSIQVDPEPKLTVEAIDKAVVSITYDSRATKKYYQINDGVLKEYTNSFEVTENCTIRAYAVSNTGVGEDIKQIDHLTTGISKPKINANPGNGTISSKVTVTIDFDRTSSIKRYKIGNGSYLDYVGPIEITENTTITAYNKNKLGYEDSSSYQITNIVPTTIVSIDKGKYYLLKLNYPENSSNREYKWQDDGVWKSYPNEGILLIKPEYKNEILNANGDLKIKIENENGQLVDFKGDYYFVTRPIQELLEKIYMRWDRTKPASPTIILNTEEPTREVKVVINYPKNHVKKQYKIVTPNDTGDWIDYTGTLNIRNNNTTIYARGQDSAEVWSEVTMKKIVNIDEEPPKIKVTADINTSTQKLGIKVEVTDDVRVETVKWASGIRGETYFNSNGNFIPNNSVFYVKENGYYTIYGKDSVGNDSTYTIQVENIDNIAPLINISIEPEDVITTSVKIKIDYEDSSLKQYKIGINNQTWSTYTGEINLTSYTVLSNKWKNSDNTVTIYAKGKDEAGNEMIAAYKILNLDLDNPIDPVITSNYGYPILTEYGVDFDGETSIKYDTRNGITNYYSIDNGATWLIYNGTFKVKESGTIIAKSSKESGLEVIASKTIGMPSDALGPAAYDGNKSTGINLSGQQLYLNVDSSMIGKKYTLLKTVYNGYQIYYKDANNQNIGNYDTSINVTGTIVTSIAIPTGTTRIYSNRGKMLYELYPENQPAIQIDVNSIAKITYNQTSVKKLYKIDNGEWKDYNENGIYVELGQVIYAKDVNKDGKTSLVSSKGNVKPLIPKLTSNKGSNGIVTVSSKYGGSWDGWIAFCERAAGDGWYATASPAWIQYQFNEDATVRQIYIYATSGSSGSNTTGLTLQYSYDGVTYNNIMNETTYTMGEYTNIIIDKTISAKYWKLNFTNASRVYNLQFYGVQ